MSGERTTSSARSAKEKPRCAHPVSMVMRAVCWECKSSQGQSVIKVFHYVISFNLSGIFWIPSLLDVINIVLAILVFFAENLHL